MEPTKQEEEKVQELKVLIKEYLVSQASLEEPVRLALAEYNADPELLLKFVRGKKLNMEKALNSVINFANVRYHRYPELFPDQVPPFVFHAFENRIVTYLKQKDDLGRTIVLFNGPKWRVSEISLEELLCSGTYLVDGLMNNPDFLTKGAILITDCADATLSHARQFTVPNIIRFISVFWQAYPVQIKGLYYVNAPMFLRPIYTMLKPFLPPKLRKRLFITSGVRELHKLVPADILPESLGGTISQEDALAVVKLPEKITV